MKPGITRSHSATDVDQDPFQVVFRPARRTLDAVALMRKSSQWLNRRKRDPLDVKRASMHRIEAIDRLELIPKDGDLYVAQRRFQQAAVEPAPEWWVHLALGAWLDSKPAAANVPDAFRHGIVDSIFRDPEIWSDDGSPGFSAPVIARAIREDRRLDAGAPPSAGRFLALCVKHREQFGRWCAEINDLVAMRQNAEDVLIALGDDRLADLGCEDEEMRSKENELERVWVDARKTILRAPGSKCP